jgi:hypothetical protein
LPRRFDKARAVRGWDEKRLLRSQRLLAAYKLPIIDELGYVPLSTIGAELILRGLQPGLRARLYHRDVQPAVHSGSTCSGPRG